MSYYSQQQPPVGVPPPQGNIMINRIKAKIEGMKVRITLFLIFIAEYVRRKTSHFLSKFPASSRDEELGSQPSQPRASSSPEPPSGVRHSQRINILDEKPDLEKELRKSLLNLSFVAAIQITIQYKQVAESEISGYIHLHSLAIAIIFACLFTSHFIGKKIPKASRKLEKAAFFLVATTFFSAIATPFRLRIKCAIWAIYILSLIFIWVIQNFTPPHPNIETLHLTNLVFHSLHQFSSSHSLWPPHPLLPIWSYHDRHSLPRQPLRPFRSSLLPLTHQSPYSLSSFPSSAHPQQIGGDVFIAALEAVVVAVE